MTTDRKPALGLWLTVALVAVLMYVGSFGPACSLCFRTSAGGQAVGVIYRPIFFLAANHCESNNVLRWYIHLCGVSDRHEPLMTESGILAWISVGPAMLRR